LFTFERVFVAAQARLLKIWAGSSRSCAISSDPSLWSPIFPEIKVYPIENTKTDTQFELAEQM
jgi:hypothetical protein